MKQWPMYPNIIFLEFPIHAVLLANNDSTNLHDIKAFYIPSRCQQNLQNTFIQCKDFIRTFLTVWDGGLTWNKPQPHGDHESIVEKVKFSLYAL